MNQEYKVSGHCFMHNRSVGELLGVIILACVYLGNAWNLGEIQYQDFITLLYLSVKCSVIHSQCIWYSVLVGPDRNIMLFLPVITHR